MEMETVSTPSRDSRKRLLPHGIFKRDGVLWIRYQDQYGRIRREKVGPSLKQAVAAYQKRKSQVREGKFFPDKLNRRVLMFAEAASDYLAYSRQFKRSYPDDVGRMQNLLRLWRSLPLTDISPGRVERDLSECAEQGSWAPATYNRYRALASAVFALAIRNEKATANPVRGTKHRTENNTRVRYLSDDEEARLLREVQKSSPRRKAEILTALFTGMRRSEQYRTRDCLGSGLRWEHIDFRNRMITVPRSKHGERRHIPMHRLVREILVQLSRQAKGPHVFPEFPPDEWFPKVCMRAQVADFTWHCLRHTFASRLVMAGVDLRTVQELMGHKSIITTMRYAHLAPKHLAEAIERLVVPATSTATSTRALSRKSATRDPQANALQGKADKWWAQQDSNLRPTDYESAALTN
jgi:integrase